MKHMSSTSLLPLVMSSLLLVACAGSGALHGYCTDHIPPEGTSIPTARVEVPMDISTGRPLVEVTINGAGPYQFILDTGAGSTVISEKLAEELELPEVGTTALGDPTDPEAIPSRLVRAEKMKIGELELSGVTMATLDLGNMMGERYGGVLGFPDLGDLLVSLDYPEKRVILMRGELEPEGRGVVAYDPSSDIIALPIKVGGEELVAHLDSGNPGSFMLPMAKVERFPLKAEPTKVGMAGTVNNMRTIYRAEIDGDIEIGGLTFTDPEVMLSDLLAEWANMGFDALQDVVVTVDQKNHRLRMVRTQMTAPRRPPRRRIGVMFQGMAGGIHSLPFKDGGLEVSEVIPGSLAEAAGIKAGDLLSTLNGRPMDDYDTEELFRTFGGEEPLHLEIRRGSDVITVLIE